MEQAGPCRILCVDDEAIIRRTVERVLSPTYEVLTLPSGENLEAALHPFQPDLIIMDVRLGNEDGSLVCSRLRRHKQFDTIPVVFMSDLNDEASVRKAFSCGGDFYLPKPFVAHDLHRIVQLFIGRKHRHPNDPR